MINKPPRHVFTVWVCCFVLFSLTQMSMFAAADDRIDRVVIISMVSCCEAEAWPEAEETLKAELRLENISTITWESLAKNKTARLDEMKRAAESRDAAAVIRLTKDAAFLKVIVDLWVTDAHTGRSTYRQFIMDMPSDATDTLDVAVRIVEALRASIHELKMKSPAPRTPLIMPAVQSNETVAPRFFAGVASSVEKSPGGLGPRGGFSLMLGLEPFRKIDLECNFYYSPFGEDLSSEYASSKLDYMMIRGQVFYRFQTPFLLEPAVGIGAGSLFVWATGYDTEGQKLNADRARVGLVGAGIRLYARVNKSFYLVLGTFAGAVIPKIELYHGKSTKAVSFGRPMMDGHLGLQVRFPN